MELGELSEPPEHQFTDLIQLCHMICIMHMIITYPEINSEAMPSNSASVKGLPRFRRLSNSQFCYFTPRQWHSQVIGIGWPPAVYSKERSLSSLTVLCPWALFCETMVVTIHSNRLPVASYPGSRWALPRAWV